MWKSPDPFKDHYYEFLSSILRIPSLGYEIYLINFNLFFKMINNKIVLIEFIDLLNFRIPARSYRLNKMFHINYCSANYTSNNIISGMSERVNKLNVVFLLLNYVNYWKILIKRFLITGLCFNVIVNLVKVFI